MSMRFVIACLAVLAAASPAWAQQGASAPNGSAPAPAALTVEQARAWGAREVAAHIDEHRATAAAAVVVQGGRILLAEQFGWADPVRGIEVSPESQFKIGSITKTFNGLMVARLVEEGSFGSVSDPINRYLRRYRLPGPNGDRVTIGEVLSHSAGFDSPNLGLAASDQREIPASSAYLRRRFPAIVREPGAYVVYSNFGMAIAGAAIEDVLGDRYDHILRARILNPLGMTHSALEYDPSGGPALIRAGLIDSTHTEQPARYAPTTTDSPLAAPSGSMQITAGDMALYLNALLGHAPETVTPAMIETQRHARHANYEGLPYAGLGIFSSTWNQHRYWYHGGLIAGFRAELLVVPDADLGIFVVYAGGATAYQNSDSEPGAAVDALLTEALGPIRSQPAIAPRANAANVAGRYWLELRAHRGPETMYNLSNVSTVTVDAQGVVSINGVPQREIAPGLYQAEEQEGRRPRLTALDGDRLLSGTLYGVRVSGLGDPAVLQMLSLACLIVVATGLLAVMERGRARFAAFGAAIVAGVFGYFLVWSPLNDPNLPQEIFTGVEWRLNLARACAWGFLLLGAITTAGAVLAWRKHGGGWLARIGYVHQLLVGLAALGQAVILAVLNVLL